MAHTYISCTIQSIVLTKITEKKCNFLAPLPVYELNIRQREHDSASPETRGAHKYLTILSVSSPSGAPWVIFIVSTENLISAVYSIRKKMGLANTYNRVRIKMVRLIVMQRGYAGIWISNELLGIKWDFSKKIVAGNN